MRLKSIFLLLFLAFALIAPQKLFGLPSCTCARFNDFKDHGCHKTPGGSGAPPQAASNAGGNKASCPTCPPPNGPALTGPDTPDASIAATGMPRWWVDEPYINLHIVDEPLFYTTSSGQKMSFQWLYKQRYDLPHYDQIPDLFYIWGNLSRIQQLGEAPYYVNQMRAYGNTNGYYAGMTNAAWAHNWMMNIVYWDARWESNYYATGFQPYPIYSSNSSYEALVFFPDGGIDYFNLNDTNQTLNTANQTNDPTSQIQLTVPSGSLALKTVTAPDGNGIYWGNLTNGLVLTYPDGSKDFFGLGWWDGPGISDFEPDSTANALLTQRIDPQGRVTRLGYVSVIFTNSCTSAINTVYLLKYVVDSDGRTNTFVYHANAGNPWQLQEVDDPFGRKATFSYESCNGWIASITDANGMSNSFNYQSGTNGWVSSLVTPYGTNSFYYEQVTESDATNGFQQRAAYVTEPDGASQLFCYIHHATNTVETNATPPSVVGWMFDDGLNGNGDEALYYRNSFYWDRAQTANLSTYVTEYLPNELGLAVDGLQATDLKVGRMQHWLMDVDGISITETLSSERDPSPDAAGAIEGSRTWYAYTNTNSFPANVYTTSQIGAIAQILPDSTTQYIRYSYYSSGYVSQNDQSYSAPGGGTAELTNQYFYAANGIDLTETTNSLGQYVNIGYNGNHEPVSITNSLNQVTTLAYDSGTYNLTNVSLYSGQTLALTYYGSPTCFLDQITLEPENTVSTVTAYSGPLPQIVHVTGTGLPDLWQTNTWDNLNRLTSVTYQDGTMISNVYTYLDLSAHEDRLGNWTYYTYDGLQHLTAITDARSNITHFSWCNCGALTEISNALGNITSLNYNNQELLTNVNFPDGSSLNWQYDLLDRMTNRFDGADSSLKYTYDNQNLIVAVSNSYGQVWAADLDAIGRPILATNVNGVVVSNTFDLLNRIVSRAWLGGGTEYFAYATNGLVAYTNQDGQWTLFGRDGAERLIALTNALQTDLFGWNGLDELNSLTDGLNHTTTWGYNQYGWLTSKTNTLGANIINYAYDADGRVTNRWMMGTNTAYTYDAVGNLKAVVYPQLTITNSYDAINELTNMIDASGTNKFTYTQTGQPASESSPWTNGTVSFGYSQGHRANLSLAQPSGGAWTQSYSYDSEWRMTGITSPAGIFGYQYPGGANALIAGIALPNGMSISNSYDSLARLTNTALANYWGHVLDGYVYGLDSLGLRTNITRLLGLTTNSVNISYDGIDEVIGWSAKESSGTLRHNEQLGYNYDAAGNLQIRTNDSLVETFTVDPLNELTNVSRSGPLTVTGATPVPATVTVDGVAAQTNGDFTFAGGSNTVSNGANTFTIVAQNIYSVGATNSLTLNLPTPVTLQYDANGNLTNDGTRVFSYDAENQLTNVFATNAWQVGFVYDGLNRRRIEKDFTWSSGWVETNEIHFIYDGMLVLQERASNNTPEVTYTRGLDLSLSRHGAGGIGGLLARSDSSGSYYYHADGNGNITALFDGNGNMAARAEYDPFGKMLKLEGSMSAKNRYWYSSKELIPQAGIYAYGFRFYEPNLQRWLNRDPIGELGGFDLYEFVGNNSMSFQDPFGLDGTLALQKLAQYAKYAGEEELAGGGPEDPAADTVAALTLLAGASVAAWDYFLPSAPVATAPPSTQVAPAVPLSANMAGTKEDKLPKAGSCPYRPKKQKGGGNPRNKQGDYIDDKGNGWRWDPKKGEWDVQHPDGSHTNVGPDGNITHGPNKF